MNAGLNHVAHYGFAIVFLWVLVEQAGLPIPSLPCLLAAGALVGAGKMSGALVLGVAVLACLIADFVWFEIGRRRGSIVLRWLCKISIEPGSCVNRTEEIFLRQGPKSILTAKFLPGIGTVVPPLAGIFKMSARRFLAYDAVGSTIWAGLFLGLGDLFSGELSLVLRYAARLGEGVAVLLVAALCGYIGWKYYQLRKYVRALRMARISPEELKKLQDEGVTLEIVDLRSQLSFSGDPYVLPGARWVDPREMVLYCNCPNEASAVRMAKLLHRYGYVRIRPLTGGLDGWRKLGFPVVRQEIPAPEATLVAQ
jgi:membrane protein DedA with SNARE-associated domain/rhodanese-related sulfurtransferase